MTMLIETPVVQAFEVAEVKVAPETKEQEQAQEKERETRLVRRWVMENGKLVSRWIEI